MSVLFHLQKKKTEEKAETDIEVEIEAVRSRIRHPIIGE